MNQKWQNIEELQIEYQTITPEKLKKGALVDGAIVTWDDERQPDGTFSKGKKVIIISPQKGCTSIYGCLVINTDERYTLDETQEEAFKESQYKMTNIGYENLLEYPSYVNCAAISIVEYKDIAKGKYCGVLKDNDMQEIWAILERSTIIPTAEKKLFHIPRKSKQYQDKIKNK